MADQVYSSELQATVSTVGSDPNNAPLFEIVLAPEAETVVTNQSGASLSNPTSHIDIVTTEQPVIDIIGIGEPGAPGQPGPQGPPGPPGTGSIEYLFTFASALREWRIDHMLNTYAIEVNVYDSNGTEYLAEVEYPSANQVIVHWYYPMSGFVRIIG